MSTYDHKQVLADYATNRITPEMAIGHGLQHIDKLYDLLKASKLEWQNKTDALDKRVTVMQSEIDRLTAFKEKMLRKAKKPTSSSTAKPNLP